MNDDTLQKKKHTRAGAKNQHWKKKKAAHAHMTISVSFNGVSSGSFIAVDLFTFDVDLAKSYLIQFEFSEFGHCSRDSICQRWYLHFYLFDFFYSLFIQPRKWIHSIHQLRYISCFGIRSPFHTHTFTRVFFSKTICCRRRRRHHHRRCYGHHHFNHRLLQQDKEKSVHRTPSQSKHTQNWEKDRERERRNPFAIPLN